MKSCKCSMCSMQQHDAYNAWLLQLISSAPKTLWCKCFCTLSSVRESAQQPGRKKSAVPMLCASMSAHVLRNVLQAKRAGGTSRSRWGRMAGAISPDSRRCSFSSLDICVSASSFLLFSSATAAGATCMVTAILMPSSKVVHACYLQHSVARKE